MPKEWQSYGIGQLFHVEQSGVTLSRIRLFRLNRRKIIFRLLVFVEKEDATAQKPQEKAKFLVAKAQVTAFPAVHKDADVNMNTSEDPVPFHVRKVEAKPRSDSRATKNPSYSGAPSYISFPLLRRESGTKDENFKARSTQGWTNAKHLSHVTDMTKKKAFTREVISHEEFLARLEAQGMEGEAQHFAFICPACHTVQSATSLFRAGVPKEEVPKYIGFSCVGRWTKAGPATGRKREKYQGCDWTLGGLLQIHELEVEKDGEKHQHFQPASKAEAQALKAHHGFTPELDEVARG
jgi:hypothetical protein